MKLLNAILVLMVSITACGCGDDSVPEQAERQSVPARYGLRESVLNRELIAGAVDLANNLLEDRFTLRLRTSWDARERGPNDVTVFLVYGGDLARDTFAFVPRGEPTIFVNAAAVPQLSSKMSPRLDDLFDLPEEPDSLLPDGGSGGGGPPGSSSDSNAVVKSSQRDQPEPVENSAPDPEATAWMLTGSWAVVLLHEAAHVAYGDHLVEHDVRSDHRAGNELTPAKTREMRCDRFAALALRSVLYQGSFEDWAVGMAHQAEIGAAQKYLKKWNEMPWFNEAMEIPPERLEKADQVRMAIDGAAMNVWLHIRLSEVGSKPPRNAQFLDQGYSHPNLQLRMVYMSALVNRTDLSRARLLDVFRHRDEPALQYLYRPEYVGLGFAEAGKSDSPSSSTGPAELSDPDRKR